MRIIDFKCRHGWILPPFKEDMNSLISVAAFDAEHRLSCHLLRISLINRQDTLNTHTLTYTLCAQVREARPASPRTPTSWRGRCTTRRWRRAPRGSASPSSEATAPTNSCRWRTCSATARLPTTTRCPPVSSCSSDSLSQFQKGRDRKSVPAQISISILLSCQEDLWVGPC